MSNQYKIGNTVLCIKSYHPGYEFTKDKYYEFIGTALSNINGELMFMVEYDDAGSIGNGLLAEYFETIDQKDKRLHNIKFNNKLKELV